MFEKAYFNLPRLEPSKTLSAKELSVDRTILHAGPGELGHDFTVLSTLIAFHAIVVLYAMCSPLDLSAGIWPSRPEAKAKPLGQAIILGR